MDDQFGGRTDDDLFADDFEPVEVAALAGAGSLAKAVKVEDASRLTAAVAPVPVPTAKPVPKPEPANAAPIKAAPTKTIPAKLTPAKTAQAKAAPLKRHTPAKEKNASASQHASVDAEAKQPLTSKSSQQQAPPPSLAQSRHNNPTPRPSTTSRAGGGKATNGQAEKNGKTEKASAGGKGEKGDKGETKHKDAKGIKDIKDEVDGKNREEKKNIDDDAKAKTENEDDDKSNGYTPNDPQEQPATSKTTTAPKQPGKNGEGNMRQQSGANPRAKLTDAELNAKMEAMRIASAEKARRFEQAQRDERDHEIAFARGMEEGRRRKAAEEEKRRRNEEDRRRMEEERARNRDRKLKAMGMKGSSWDEGKKAARADDDDGQQHRGSSAFRGAHGGIRGIGIRGSRHAGGILPIAHFDIAGGIAPLIAADSAAALPAAPTRVLQPGEFRGRGRGRGRGHGTGIIRNIGGRRGGSGGGGRVAFDDVFGNGAGVAEWVQGQPDPSAMAPPGSSAPELSTEEFPALPGSSSNTKDDKGSTVSVPDSAVAAASIVPPLSPPLGTWDEEVAAMDAELAAAAANNGH